MTEDKCAITRAMYERLIALSGHLKMWISSALFEAEAIPLPRAERKDEDGDEEKEKKPRWPPKNRPLLGRRSRGVIRISRART